MRTSNFGHFSKMGPNWKYLPKLNKPPFIKNACLLYCKVWTQMVLCPMASPGFEARPRGRGFPPVCFLTVPACFLCRLRRLSIRSVKSRSCCFWFRANFIEKEYSIEMDFFFLVSGIISLIFRISGSVYQAKYNFDIWSEMSNFKNWVYTSF